MTNRRLMLRQRQKSSGGGWLTLAVVLMAVGACLLMSPPKPLEVASIFSHRSAAQTPGGAPIVLPAKSWFLVISNSQAVAACGSLMEAEIIRDSYGELAGIQAVEAAPISMRVTAPDAQQTALRQGADSIIEVFRTLDKMAHLSPEDAASCAKSSHQCLMKLYDTMDTAFSGTQNAVARGLCGLVGACCEAMSELSANPTTNRIQYQYVSLVQQYAAYTDYLAGIV